MAEEKGPEKKLAIGLLIVILFQIITLAFLWNPEWFKQTVAKLNDAVNKGKEKVKDAVQRDKKDKDGE